MQCLQKVLKAWEQGQHVTVEVVDVINDHGQDINDCVEDNPCDDDVDLAIDNVEADNNPPSNVNHLDIEESQPDLNHHMILILMNHCLI